MKYVLVSAAAVMALTGAATLGHAQAPDNDKGKGPAAEGKASDKAPGSGARERAPGAGERTQQPANRAEPKSEPRRGAEREPGKDQPRAAQREGQQPKSTQGSDADKDRKSATQPQRDKDQPRSTEQRQGGKDERKSTETKQPTKDERKATETKPQPGKDDRKAADQKQPGGDQQKSTQGPAQGSDQKRVQVSEEKRSGVRERITKERNVQRQRINVSINIGTPLPRSIRLYRMPITIVSFEPAYRGYSYVLLEDETIVIVDERTYLIVDVIPAGTQRADGPGRGYLTLSADDMRFIYRTAPRDRTANVRVRLALGAEVPRDVDLVAFPNDMVERVPDLRRYRYIVTENDIVIVDPDSHAVALVITE
jgi:uncharacterized protein DUF1236